MYKILQTYIKVYIGKHIEEKRKLHTQNSHFSQTILVKMQQLSILVNRSDQNYVIALSL